MTVELDNVVKNLNGEALTVELEEDNGTVWVYIGTDNSSGTEYKVQSVEEVGEFVTNYLLNYLSDEVEDEDEDEDDEED